MALAWGARLSSSAVMPGGVLLSMEEGDSSLAVEAVGGSGVVILLLRGRVHVRGGGRTAGLWEMGAWSGPLL